MADALYVTVRSLHILSGVLWVGGLAFAALIVARAMRKTPAGASGLALVRLGPGGFRFLTYAGVATLLFGFWNQHLIAGGIDYRAGPWNMALGASVFLSIAMLGVLGGMIMPAMRRLVAQADRPGAATAATPTPEVAALQRRLALGAYLSLALGVVAVILMAYAVAVRTGG